MDKKVKHLEMIQSIINQIANHSFMIRGWCLTLVSALFSIAIIAADPKYLVVAYIPIPVFWLLDGFYFSQERAFRALFNRVRMLQEDEVDFSMNKGDFSVKENSWGHAIRSKTLTIFYLTLTVTVTVVLLVLQ
jgi:hypothetical protein